MPKKPNWEDRIEEAAKRYRDHRQVVSRNACVGGATKYQVDALIYAAIELAELYVDPDLEGI